MSKSQNQPLRIYVDSQTVRLLKAVAGLKDASVNSLVNEAIETWLNLPDQQKLIEKHSLDEIEDSNAM
ncbi:MAG: hypothetical protein AAFO04_22660 [Cyanobacteria bacterium J06592_8]|nr:hypothetical protein [Cyanobacteriota bacterium]